jgi:hypothetical protein
MKNNFKIMSYISTIFLLLFLISCAGFYSGKSATVSPDNSVTKSFQDLQINPSFNYYITGSDSFPRTILGLNKTYTFNSDLWKKIEPTPANFYLLVNNMRGKANSRGLTVLGCSLTDENSKQIGVWYSIVVSGFSIRITENREVIVYPPNDKLYQGYDDQMSSKE